MCLCGSNFQSRWRRKKRFEFTKWLHTSTIKASLARLKLSSLNSSTTSANMAPCISRVYPIAPADGISIWKYSQVSWITIRGERERLQLVYEIFCKPDYGSIASRWLQLMLGGVHSHSGLLTVHSEWVRFRAVMVTTIGEGSLIHLSVSLLLARWLSPLIQSGWYDISIQQRKRWSWSKALTYGYWLLFPDVTWTWKYLSTGINICKTRSEPSRVRSLALNKFHSKCSVLVSCSLSCWEDSHDDESWASDPSSKRSNIPILSVVFVWSRRWMSCGLICSAQMTGRSSPLLSSSWSSSGKRREESRRLPDWSLMISGSEISFPFLLPNGFCTSSSAYSFSFSSHRIIIELIS